MDRFWSKVDKSGECWLWTAHRRPAGYGRFRIDGRTVDAHRYAYETCVGPIPAGFEMHHECEERGCVNPAHLRPLSVTEHRRHHPGPGAIQRAKTHCPQGHPYDEVNTYKTNSGKRVCRTCLRARGRKGRGSVAV